VDSFVLVYLKRKKIEGKVREMVLLEGGLEVMGESGVGVEGW